MIKLTVLYGHPVEPTVFEEYYANIHLPIVATMKGFEKAEYTKFLSAADGSKSVHYRMAEFWYKDTDSLQASMGSAEGKATAADLANFATGGVTISVGIVEN